jgi:hypothetical protein
MSTAPHLASRAFAGRTSPSSFSPQRLHFQQLNLVQQTHNTPVYRNESARNVDFQGEKLDNLKTPRICLLQSTLFILGEARLRTKA